MTKNKGGRPTKMTPEVVQKLRTAFAYAYTNVEAAAYAGISERKLQYYFIENPAFLREKERLLQMPNLKAKKELVEGIDGNLDQSRWWALHRMSDQFNTKTQVQHSGKIQTEDLTNAPPPEAIEKAISAFKTTLRQAVAEAHGKTL